MLVLVATNELQGREVGDYARTVEGELVTPMVTECADGDACGCNRGFPGLASGKATTTAMVVDRPGVTEQDLRDAVFDWLDRGGWIELLIGDFDEIDVIVDGVIDEHVELIMEVCTAHPEGTVVARHGQFVTARLFPSAA